MSRSRSRCRCRPARPHVTPPLPDFRNGPLRRKYDGLKYSLRRLQDILYEQSLVGGGGAAVDDEPAAAAATATALDGAAIDGVRERLEAFDARREAVIKGTRDTQKLSKLAVYSLHRGELAKAAKQLADGAAAAAKLAPDIAARPALRPGSYANCLEECVAVPVLLLLLLLSLRVAATTPAPPLLPLLLLRPPLLLQASPTPRLPGTPKGGSSSTGCSPRAGGRSSRRPPCPSAPRPSTSADW